MPSTALPAITHYHPRRLGAHPRSLPSRSTKTPSSYPVEEQFLQKTPAFQSGNLGQPDPLQPAQPAQPALSTQKLKLKPRRSVLVSPAFLNPVHGRNWNIHLLPAIRQYPNSSSESLFHHLSLCLLSPPAALEEKARLQSRRSFRGRLDQAAQRLPPLQHPSQQIPLLPL